MAHLEQLAALHASMGLYLSLVTPDVTQAEAVNFGGEDLKQANL